MKRLSRSGVPENRRNRRRDAVPSRAEAGAQARRRRAMAHLERVRNQRERQAPPLRAAAAAVVAVSAVVGLLAGAGGSSQAPVERVFVTGARWLSDAEVAAAAGIAGPGGAGVDPATLAERLSEHAWIESARVLALPGGALLLGVRERQPAAVLAGEEPWAIDAAGVPFAPLPAGGSEDLPLVAADTRPETGQPDADLARAVAVVGRLPGLGLPAPQAVRVAAPDDPKGLSLLLPGLPPEVVLGREDLDARLADLARLLDAGLPELEGAARIDLRFEDQAVLDRKPSLEGAEQAAAQRGVVAPSNSRRAG